MADEPLVEPTPDIEDARRQKVIVELDAMTLVSLAVGVLVTWAVVALFRRAADIMTVLAVGILLALALDPLVTRIRTRFDCRRSVAVIAVCLGLAVSFSLLVVFLGPAAVRQAADFGDELPQTVEGLYSFPLVGDRLEEADASGRVVEWVESLPGDLTGDRLAELMERFIGGLIAALMVLVVAFAVLLDGDLLVGRLRKAIPEQHRERADWLGSVFYRTLSKYFAGSLLLALMTGTYVLMIGLALGVPLAPLAAIWAAITDLIPQVGGFLGGSLFVILALTVGVGTGVLALVLFVAYMSTENYLIQPAVVGNAVSLSPPATMIAAFVGGLSLGVPGALAATPFVATVKALYLELRFGPPDEEEDEGPRLPLVGPVRDLVARLRGRSTAA